MLEVAHFQIGRKMNRNKESRNCSAASDLLIQDYPVAKMDCFLHIDVY